MRSANKNPTHVHSLLFRGQNSKYFNFLISFEAIFICSCPKCKYKTRNFLFSLSNKQISFINNIFMVDFVWLYQRFFPFFWSLFLELLNQKNPPPHHSPTKHTNPKFIELLVNAKLFLKRQIKNKLHELLSILKYHHFVHSKMVISLDFFLL